MDNEITINGTRYRKVDEEEKKEEELYTPKVEVAYLMCGKCTVAGSGHAEIRNTKIERMDTIDKLYQRGRMRW